MENDAYFPVVLGVTFLRGYLAIFNLENSTISFGHSKPDYDFTKYNLIEKTAIL